MPWQLNIAPLLAEYQPTGTLGFELSNLAQNTLKVLDWKSYIWATLDTWGHYASCLVILYLTGKLIYTLVSVVVTRRKGTSWATALRLNTFLLAEFRNNLIQTLHETERGVAAAPTHGIELEELNWSWPPWQWWWWLSILWAIHASGGYCCISDCSLHEWTIPWIQQDARESVHPGL